VVTQELGDVLGALDRLADRSLLVDHQDIMSLPGEDPRRR
jgi:hypothetical protein